MANDSTNDNARRQTPASHPALERLDALAGEWRIEGIHSQLKDTVVHGRVRFEWLDGGFFLVQRSEVDHPEFPNNIAIIGPDDSAENCTMHYFDSRGVSRAYETNVRDGVWTLWRDAPGFSQRFTGTFSDDGNSIMGRWEISRDDVNWEHDFELTYSKVT